MIVPSSSFSAMLPVKPSVTTTSAAPRSRSRLSALPREVEAALAQQRMRVEGQRVALLVLLADREQAHLRVARRRAARWLKTAPIWANWSRCSARASALAPASSSTEGPSRAGIGTAIAGRITPGRRRRWIIPAASTAPVLPAETTASVVPSATERTAATRLESGFAAHRLRGLVGHLDRLGRDDERQPLRVEAFGPEERHLDPVGGGVERAEDHLVGRVVSSKRVDCDAGHLRSVETERFDLAALVGAAGRADAMGALRRAALRARVDARSLDAVGRAALVAA